MLHYPNIDPILFSFGPIQIRWYGLAYIAGLVIPFFLFKKTWKYELKLSVDDIYNFITYFYGSKTHQVLPLWALGSVGLLKRVFSISISVSTFPSKLYPVQSNIAVVCPLSLKSAANNPKTGGTRLMSRSFGYINKTRHRVITMPIACFLS